MYFAFGWPRALYTGVVDDDEEVVEMCFGRNYLVLVLRRCVQFWSGGQHRLKLGEPPLTEASLQEDGDNQAAHWCSSRRMLAVLVSARALACTRSPPPPPTCPAPRTLPPARPTAEAGGRACKT